MPRPVLLAALAAVSIAPVTCAQVVVPEVEPNNSKAEANAVNALQSGDAVTGVSLSSTGAGLDYFLLTTAPRPQGLYRYQMVLTSPILGHIGTIRGQSQIDGVVVGGDITVQSSAAGTVPPFFNQWYGFGRETKVFYRVAGLASTFQPYTATLEVQPVQAQSLGQFAPGQLTITTLNQGHFTDTDLWVYDANFNAIPGFGNDDEGITGPAGTGITQLSHLERTFLPGVYYLAITDGNFANNLASPPDDDRNGAVLDFSDVAAGSSTLTGVDLSFALVDSTGQQRAFAAQKTAAYEVQWYQFVVVPTPASGTMLAILGACAVRRRRP